MRLFSTPIGARTRGTRGGPLRQNERRGFQIGPRIRIGGSVGKAGQAIKEGAGKVLSNKYVDMAASLIPGVGPGIAAAANAAGHVLDTSGGGIHSVGDVANIAKDAGTTYLGSKVLAKAKGAIGRDGLLSSAKKLITGGGSDGKGSAGVVGDIAGKLTSGPSGDRGGVLDKLLLAGSVASSAADRKRQQDMQDRASHYATDSYDSRAGLRERGLSQALNPEKPDLSDVFAAPGNPYAVSARKPVAPAPAVNSVVPPTLGTRSPVRRLSL